MISVLPALRVLGWCEHAETRVGPIVVVVDAPVADDDLGFEERIESFAVEQFVAGATVERFDPRVLPR